MNYNPKEFGMRITKLRKELGKTQQETADLLHTSLDNYRGIEKGRRNPSLDLLVAMSAAFGVSLDRLVLGRMTLTDRNHVQRELEDIMIQISRLRDSI
jgi:transcriptional regulator with XRE-family HTH domain